jgi:hypothetical protein
MSTPYLHLQLHEQLRQWIEPLDQRHLKVFSEIMAAMLQSQSACLSRWIPLLGHRDCSARSHLERLSYFVHNPCIVAQTFYVPLLKHFLATYAGLPLELTLDTHLRDAQALTCLVMLMDCATLLVIVLGTMVVHMGQRVPLDWHPQRGLSFLQLGLRELQRLLHCGERLPILEQLPRKIPPKAFASKRKREELECRIEFSRITTLAF